MIFVSYGINQDNALIRLETLAQDGKSVTPTRLAIKGIQKRFADFE